VVHRDGKFRFADLFDPLSNPVYLRFKPGVTRVKNARGLGQVRWTDAHDINTILGRDYPVLQGVLLFIAFFYLIINLIVDMLYSFLDPRMRLS
jgi:hypothetical protein